MSDLEIVDRYSATGTPYPDENSCDECDGMGLFPVDVNELNHQACLAPNNELTVIGQKDENGNSMPNDGWLIVRCPACNGTRIKTTEV